jgi:4-amino-4-deoxy-L-arabinose transferase-like glycosyltransferase
LIMTAAWVVVAAPWYVACWMVNGQAFVDEFIIKHHLTRFLSPELQHVQPWWFYVPILLGLLFPWSPAIALLFRKEQYTDYRTRFLGAVAVLGFVFFSAATNKLPGYLLPLVPIVSALIGIRIADGPTHPAVFVTAAILLAAVPVVAAVLPDALVYGSAKAPMTLIAEINPFLVLAILIVPGLCWWAETRGKRSLAIGVIFGATVASVVALKTFTFPLLDEKASARRLWSTLKAKHNFSCVEDNLPRGIRYGLNYYAGYKLPPCKAVPSK